jgi:polyferredoxin
VALSHEAIKRTESERIVTKLALTILILLMLSGPVQLFVALRYPSIVAKSPLMQKQFARGWMTFAFSALGLALLLAGFVTALETLITVIGVILLFEVFLHNWKPKT